MVVNVKGRDIHIDDELANKYEMAFLAPIDERTILMYIDMFTKSNGADANIFSVEQIEEWVKTAIECETEDYIKR